MIRLEPPSLRRRDEFLAAARRSRQLHRHWASPPRTAASYRAYVQRMRSPRHIGYLVCAVSGELAGVININEIVRGSFQSGYLGYYAFLPHAGQGLMTAALGAVIRQAFREHGLHRLEANIQPDNERSLRLVRRLGFRREGFSPRYLKVAGRWRDHQRWAITKEDWQVHARRRRSA